MTREPVAQEEKIEERQEETTEETQGETAENIEEKDNLYF